MTYDLETCKDCHLFGDSWSGINPTNPSQSQGGRSTSVTPDSILKETPEMQHNH